jgi:HSP20 family protein
MNSPTRFDPFREMMTLRSAMDRLFDSAFLSPSSVWQGTAFQELALDVVETEDEYVVKASIPGINPDDLELTFAENTLTLKGEVKAEEEKEGTRYHLRERRTGTFTRSITLPSGIKADEIEANYEAGMLNIHLPKVEEVKPKRIAVSGTSGQRQHVIEAKTGNGSKR